MGFRCAFLGCGPRATGHAEAYAHITRGEPVAACDLDEGRLAAFADRYGIPGRYTNLDEMLDREKPDVVHMVTQPTLRVGLMTHLADAGVPGVIVEKPICIGGDDYAELKALAARSRTRFATNHQLRFHPRVLEYLDDIRSGAIGEVRHIDASAVYPMAGQGTHILNLLLAFNGYARCKTVFGVASGYDDINSFHPGPKAAQMLLTFENGTRASLQTGPGSPQFVEGPDWAHKRIAIYGTKGIRHWWMYGWERTRADGSLERGEQDYAAQDVLGQAGLTNAMFDWIEDDAKVHPNSLEWSLYEWLIVLGCYLSTVEARAVDLPFDPPGDLLARLKRFVGAA